MSVIKAIKIIMDNLPKAVNQPDRQSRDKMSEGSLLAGLAFSNTQTTICHSVSYPITACWGVSHGQAVAITLPSFIAYTLPALTLARRKDLLLVLGSKSAEEAGEKITALMRQIGLKTKLSELGIKHTDIEIIVQKGFHPDRADNAPRIPLPQELKELLEAIL